MNLQWTPLTIFLSAAALMSFVSAAFTWRRFGYKPAARMGAGLLVAVGWWVMGSVMEFSSVEPAYRQFWDKAQFVAIVSLPPGWATYTMRYVGQASKLTRRRFLLLWLIPTLTLLLVFTNGLHGLIWARYELTVIDGAVIKSATYGPAFWLFMVHAYVMVFVGLVVLLRAVVDSGRLYRWQVIGLAIIVIVPWLVNSASVFFNWKPLWGMDLTPLTLGLTASVAGWTMYRLQMRDVGPTARHMMIEQMGDGVLVLDAAHGIIDLNPVVKNLLQRPKSQLFGRPITQFWPDWPHEALEADHQDAGVTEWTVGDDETRTFDMRVTPLFDGRNRLVSRIIVLRDIGERKQMEEQLKASLQEKDALLKEIHHRVKNNLQIISSLLNLQSSQNGNEAVTQALQEGQSRVRSMALIHEVLYRSDDLAQIDFGAYIRQLTAQLHQTYNVHAGRVAVDVQTDEVFLTMETAVPCGLILNELVTNALKHGFGNGRSGQIQITLQSVANQLALTVADDGRGIPAAIDFQQTTTLGLQLVTTLVSQINGQIMLDRNHGTTFKITFIAP